MTKIVLLLIFIWFQSFVPLFAKTLTDDRKSIKKYKEQCEEIKKFKVRKSYTVECTDLYQHYNSSSFTKNYSIKNIVANRIKIATYNLLHPGSHLSLFKDFPLMARVINRWDLLGAVELFPVVGRDLKK